MTPTCSVVIASLNRAHLLGETLENLLSSNVLTSAIDCELIIVDNNSSDGTRALAETYASRFRIASVHSEFRQGLAYARNKGVEVASGQIVVFLDDDVEVDANWLCKLLVPFDDPSVGAVGGKVLPYGLATFPDWLPRDYAFLASVFDPSDVPCNVSTVMGANFAVRRSLLEHVGGFNTNLGRKGTKLLGGEEVELFKRISEAGYCIRYTPHSVVWHKIANKLRLEYIVNYAYWLGVSEAYIDKTIIGRVRFALKYGRSAIYPLLLYRWSALTYVDAAAQTRRLIKRAYARGYLASAREMSTCDL